MGSSAVALQDHQRSVVRRRRDETKDTALAKFEGTHKAALGGCAVVNGGIVFSISSACAMYSSANFRSAACVTTSPIDIERVCATGICRLELANRWSVGTWGDPVRSTIWGRTRETVVKTEHPVALRSFRRGNQIRPLGGKTRPAKRATNCASAA